MNRTEQNRTVQISWKGPAKIIQLPDHSRTNQKLRHVIEGVIQMPPEH